MIFDELKEKLKLIPIANYAQIAQNGDYLIYDSSSRENANTQIRNFQIILARNTLEMETYSILKELKDMEDKIFRFESERRQTILNGVKSAFITNTLYAYIFSLERGLLTIVSMYVAYKMLDKIQMGFGDTKQIMIVTSKQREVTDRILSDLHRGVTLLHGEGAFTHKQQNVVYCIVSTRQVVTIKRILDEVDPTAFLIISEAYEVKGRGFKIQEI